MPRRNGAWRGRRSAVGDRNAWRLAPRAVIGSEREAVLRPGARSARKEGDAMRNRSPGCASTRMRRAVADSDARRSEAIAVASRPAFLHRRSLTKPSSAGRRKAPRGRSPAARFDGVAERIQGRARNMLIAGDGEELVCPKGTICGRMTRDANDRITDGDFAVLETCVSPDGQRYVCACCQRTVAVREHFRWRVHLRRGWIR